ncbi:MAG: CxxxxCH/CxxCH domain-containing protein [Deltaproteobacteria bacterium]|nr:CxxxxCH/CxxCH domain-containing protein [Deltaproteobacteria bacterium]
MDPLSATGLIFIFGVVLGACEKFFAPPPDETEGDVCKKCHTSPDEPASSSFHLFGRADQGAHDAHRQTRFTRPIGCPQCHTLPTPETLWETPTHINQSVDIYAQDNPWIQGYDSLTAECTTACHVPRRWTEKHEENCSFCHTKTVPPHDITDRRICSRCHTETIGSDGQFISLDKHIDGAIEVRQNICEGCHEYPPDSHMANQPDDVVTQLIMGCDHCHLEKPVSGFRTSVDDPHRSGTVDFQENLCVSCHDFPPTDGAHPTHTNDAGIACTTCHEALPTTDDTIFYHMSTTTKVSFPEGPAMINHHGDPLQPAWDDSAKTCSSIGCHGAGLAAGQLMSPLSWDDQSGEAKECGACHHVPPSEPEFHQLFQSQGESSCPECHTPVPSEEHVNGEVNLRP